MKRLASRLWGESDDTDEDEAANNTPITLREVEERKRSQCAASAYDRLHDDVPESAATTSRRSASTDVLEPAPQ